MEDIKLNYDDITIVPEIITTINSRSECNPYDENGMLPIFASCMSSVVSIENAKDFNDAKIYAVIPRSYPLERRLYYLSLNNKNFVAFSLKEAEDVFVKGDATYYHPYRMSKHLGVCIDLANGHMEKLLEVCKAIKDKYGDTFDIMTGNIANPEAYRLYEKAGVDYVRCGIGGGSLCVVEGTMITMADGTNESIENINVGDYVKTIDGNHRVINVFDNGVKSTILINDVECTFEHKFFCIRKDIVKDINTVTDDFIKEHGEYVEAKNLSKEKYYLVQV